MREEWRDVPDFEDIYEISSEGRLFNKRTNAELRPGKIQRGDLQAHLRVADRPHRHPPLKNLVWETFRGKVPSSEKVICADGDPANCRLSNLKLVSVFKIPPETVAWARAQRRTYNSRVSDLAHAIGTDYDSLYSALGRHRAALPRVDPGPPVAPRPNGKLLGEKQPMARLTDRKVKWIRDQYHSKGRPCPALAKELGVSTTVTWMAAVGRTWRHVPMPATTRPSDAPKCRPPRRSRSQNRR